MKLVKGSKIQLSWHLGICTDILNICKHFTLLFLCHNEYNQAATGSLLCYLFTHVCRLTQLLSQREPPSHDCLTLINVAIWTPLSTWAWVSGWLYRTIIYIYLSIVFIKLPPPTGLILVLSPTFGVAKLVFTFRCANKYIILRNYYFSKNLVCELLRDANN